MRQFGDDPLCAVCLHTCALPCRSRQQVIPQALAGDGGAGSIGGGKGSGCSGGGGGGGWGWGGDGV
jgi:hypothetical protein